MTVSANNIGNCGHLGNQMFQYASVKGISSKYNRDIIIPPTDFFGKHYPSLRSNIDECFNIDCERGVTNFPTYQEKHFHFDEFIFNNLPESPIDLSGYFQSEKYFKHIKNEIKKDFTFVDDILDPCKEYINQFDEVIGIHIRRTDYVVNDNHPTMNENYYEKALSKLDENIPVIIVSDDINWCKEKNLFNGDRFFASETGNAYLDLCLLTLCNYHVIANSTFSWWGAWLADSKKVIAPKNWFGSPLSHYKTKDIYCDEWEIL